MAWYRMTGSGELHGAVISGSTSESTLIGQTVNLTKNDEIIQTDIIASDGTFSFIDIQDEGTYIISTVDKNDVPCDYSVSINATHIINKTVLSITLILKYSTILGTTSEISLYGKTAKLYSGSTLVKSSLINSSGSFNFIVTTSGNYTIKATDGTDEASTDVTISSDDINNKVNKSVDLSFLKIVTFANGTYEEIAKMVQAHYNNKINLSDYWAVGDTRNVSLSAMSATGVSESHRAQTVQFVIGDFEHDELTTPINGHTKTAVTLLQKDCLMDATSASNLNNGSADTERGYMNSSNTNSGGWKNCARRTWCNNVYYNALPSALRSIVKTVNKKSGTGGGSSSGTEITQDKIFLAAEIEIFGSRSYSVEGEGTRYQYYKNATANRYKMPKWSSSSVSHIYWERSPTSGHSAYTFCYVYGDGSATLSNHEGYAFGFAPCLNL